MKVRARGAGTYDVEVTISSPYDTPARYADAFRVTTGAGALLGTRELLHDHADEQPFTRELTGVVVPPGVSVVVVHGRDRLDGYGGASRDRDRAGALRAGCRGRTLRVTRPRPGPPRPPARPP